MWRRSGGRMCLCALACLTVGLLGEGRALAQRSRGTVPEPPPLQAPEKYYVKLETTKGDVVIEVHRDWSPYGADRFYELAKTGFYDGCRFFRVIDGFMAQVGINGTPEINAKWADKRIPDDRPAPGNQQSNQRGYVTFAKSGQPHSRTTQIFINYRDNARLDEMGFTPFGRVAEGMQVVDALYNGYGEQTMGRQTMPRIQAEGNAYLTAAFPKLDEIKKARIVRLTRAQGR